ncbi:TPA: ead/Ea22-like family protein [Escherichia coli]|nr:ead/Ea22-like family protein [Escherichia coli]
MRVIDYQALREVAEAIKVVATPQKLLAFRMKVTPQVVLALLDEIKHMEDTNIDAMCRIAELEARTVFLPELPVPGSTAEWYEGFAAGASSMRNECTDAIRVAGIRIKGE